MSLLRKALTVAFVTIVPLVMLNLSATAHAFPTGEYPHVHCTRIAIDPAHWITVRFVGTIGGVAFDRTVAYGADPAHPHSAWIDISDLTTGTGPLAYDVTATSPYLGTAHSSGTITCHDEPTTTTTTEPPTTTTSTTVKAATTTTQAPTTTTTGPCDQFARGVAPTDMRSGAQACTTTTVTPTTRLGIAPPRTLPFTGGSSRPLGALGGGLIGLGALAAIGLRRRAR